MNKIFYNNISSYINMNFWGWCYLKFGVDIGHNVAYDIGAHGIRKEDELTKEVGIKLMERLKKLGHTVVNCTPESASNLGDSLYKRVLIANQNNIDYFISIHFNSGGENGTEIFVLSEEGRALGEKILSEIVALGFYNRGIKDGNRLYVLKNTKATGILMEIAFVDSKEDMYLYNSDSIVNAIIKGINSRISR